MLKLVKRRVGRIAGPLVRPLGRRLGLDDGFQSSTARSTSLSLRLPNPYGGRPWLTATLAVSSVPRGYGELMRLRAHLDGCLSMPAQALDRAALAHDQMGRRSLLGLGRSAAASLVRGAVERLPAEHIARLGARRWRSWLDIQFSTAPLDGGADALMPKALRDMYGDGLPRLGPNQPRVGVWAGPAGGPNGGVARLAMIQIDEEDVRAGERVADAERFNLSMSIAQLVEPVVPGGDADVDNDSDPGPWR